MCVSLTPWIREVCVAHPLDHHSFKTMGFTPVLQLTVVYTHNFHNNGPPQIFVQVWSTALSLQPKVYQTIEAFEKSFEDT